MCVCVCVCVCVYVGVRVYQCQCQHVSVSSVLGGLSRVFVLEILEGKKTSQVRRSNPSGARQLRTKALRCRARGRAAAEGLYAR